MSIPKVLLVDDVHLFLEIEKGFLEGSPVEIITAHDGEEALETIRRERPALVIMDINMPRMDGIACCAAIKADPELASTPVIMLTNSGRNEDLQQSWRAGCDDFIVKPVSDRVFLEKTRRFLEVIERRKKRVPIQVPASLQINGQTFSGTSEDLSYNGMYVASTCDTLQDEILTVSFRIFEDSPSAVIARGRVAWLNPEPASKKAAYKPGFGIEFLEIIGEGLAMLRANEVRAYVDLHKALN